MKWLKFVLYLILLLVVAGFILPPTTRLERSVDIEVPVNTAFAYLNSLHNFSVWSPWRRLDPQIRYQFSGADAGAGAKLSWASESKLVGRGSQEIINTVPGKQIELVLDFRGMAAEASYLLQSSGDKGTTVTWVFAADHGWSLLARYRGFLFTETLVGRMYEQGLTNLKQNLEAEWQKQMANPIEIATEKVNYQVGEQQFNGYLAYPVGAKPGPGVLVVHEWWGQNDYTRSRAEMLAREGYTALALDMYGSGKLADHPDDAGKFMNAVIEQEGAIKARFEAGMSVLQARPTVQPDQIAAIGYCFGGAVVLNMARAGLPLRGVASFHGVLATENPAQPGQVKAKVRVYHGNADPMVTQEHVEAFKAEMDAAGVDYSVTGYDGVTHSFTNPAADTIAEKYGMPVGYDAAADADSWKSLLAFFDELFPEK